MASAVNGVSLVFLFVGLVSCVDSLCPSKSFFSYKETCYMLAYIETKFKHIIGTMHSKFYFRYNFSLLISVYTKKE